MSEEGYGADLSPAGSLYDRVTWVDVTHGLFENLRRNNFVDDSDLEAASSTPYEPSAGTIANRFHANLEGNRTAINQAPSPLQKAVVEMKLLVDITCDLIEHTGLFALEGESNKLGAEGVVQSDVSTEIRYATANRCDMLRATLFDFQYAVRNLSMNSHVSLEQHTAPMFSESLSKLDFQTIETFKTQLMDVQTATQNLGCSRGEANEHLLRLTEYLGKIVVPEMEVIAQQIQAELSAKPTELEPVVMPNQGESGVVEALASPDAATGKPTAAEIAAKRWGVESIDPAHACRPPNRTITFAALVEAQRVEAKRRESGRRDGNDDPYKGPDVV